MASSGTYHDFRISNLFNHMGWNLYRQTMFKIEDKKWPGVAKCLEEMSELSTEFGRLIANNGKVKHWNGTDLKLTIKDEVADVLAALTFFVDYNMNDLEIEYILDRMKRKFDTFNGWREDLNKKGD